MAGVVALASAFDQASAFKSFMQGQMNQYVAAIKSRDLTKIEQVIKANFSADFKDTDLKGQVRNRDKTIDGMQRNVSSLQALDFISAKIESAKVMGNKASTVEHMILKGSLRGTDPAKPDKLSVDSVWTATYVKQGGRWLCTTSKTIKEKVLVNGKPVS